MKTKNDKPKSSTRKKILFIGLGALATGLLSYFGLQFWKKHKQASTTDADAPDVSAESSPGEGNKATSEKTKSSFHKTATKPKRKGQAKSSSDKTASSSTADFNPSQLAADLHASVSKKDFTKTKDLVANIKTAGQYLQVSKIYQSTPTGSKKLTLVGGLLATFRSITQRAWLAKTFIGMGLKYNGKSWSLSGTGEEKLLITTSATKVWKDPKTFVQVPGNMVLGKELAKRGQFSLFENDKKFFLVESNAVNYYNN